MTTLDDRPSPPPVPRFSRDMEQFLLAAVRASTPARSTDPSPATPRRRRFRYIVAAFVAAAVIAGTAVGIGLATSGGSLAPGANPTDGPSGGTDVHLAAFTVATNADGTVSLSLSLTQGRLFDPAALRRALAKAGVSAVVTVGSVCTVPGHPSDGLPQVISRSPAANGRSVTTITPSAIPNGEKLSFGYFARATSGAGGLFISLVPDHASLTCSSTPPAPPGRGSGGRR